MSKTILTIGDVHFKLGNIQEVDLFIQKINKVASDLNPDIIVILGDVLDTHERIHTTPLNKAYEFIDNMRKIAHTFVLVGNHDMCNNQQFLSENHWMNGMKKWENVTIVDTVVQHIFTDTSERKLPKIILCPYVPNGRFEEALNTIGENNWRNSNLIFAHQEFEGCKMGHIISVSGDKWSLENPTVISGHIHLKHRPQENIIYIGSAIQHAFGESENNTISLIELSALEHDNGNIVSKTSFINTEIDLQLPKKKIIYMDVEEIVDFIIPETNDKIKITVSGSFDQFKSLKKTPKYKKIIDKGIKIIFKERRVNYTTGDNSNGECPNNLCNFINILTELVLKEPDCYLSEMFDLVIDNNIVSLIIND